MPATAPAAITRYTPIVLAVDLAQLASTDPAAYGRLMYEVAEALEDARHMEGAGPFARAAERSARYIRDSVVQYAMVADNLAADLDESTVTLTDAGRRALEAAVEF